MKRRSLVEELERRVLVAERDALEARQEAVQQKRIVSSLIKANERKQRAMEDLRSRMDGLLRENARLRMKSAGRVPAKTPPTQKKLNIDMADNNASKISYENMDQVISSITKDLPFAGRKALAVVSGNTGLGEENQLATAFRS